MNQYRVVFVCAGGLGPAGPKKLLGTRLPLIDLALLHRDSVPYRCFSTHCKECNASARLPDRRPDPTPAGLVLCGGRALCVNPFYQCRFPGECCLHVPGKLLLNMTNAVNALSGIPIAAMFLEHKSYRTVLAMSIREAQVMRGRVGVGVGWEWGWGGGEGTV